MSLNEVATDVAKVLQGTHLIRIIEVPGREYDLVNRLLENKEFLEDAEWASAIVNRRVSLCPGYFLELSMYNPKDDEEEPVLSINLMGEGLNKNSKEEWMVESLSVTDRIPDIVEFDKKDTDGRTFRIKLRRK